MRIDAGNDVRKPSKGLTGRQSKLPTRGEFEGREFRAPDISPGIFPGRRAAVFRIARCGTKMFFGRHFAKPGVCSGSRGAANPLNQNPAADHVVKHLSRNPVGQFAGHARDQFESQGRMLGGDRSQRTPHDGCRLGADIAASLGAGASPRREMTARPEPVRKVRASADGGFGPTNGRHEFEPAVLTRASRARILSQIGSDHQRSDQLP